MRINDLKLPLDHSEDALRIAIVKKLGIAPEELLSFNIFKRSHDARKSSAIVLIYSVDVVLRDGQQVFQRLQGDRQIRSTPDMSYKFVADGRGNQNAKRPVAIGTGPCGLLCRLDPCANGSPDHS